MIKQLVSEFAQRSGASLTTERRIFYKNCRKMISSQNKRARTPKRMGTNVTLIKELYRRVLNFATKKERENNPNASGMTSVLSHARHCVMNFLVLLVYAEPIWSNKAFKTPCVNFHAKCHLRNDALINLIELIKYNLSLLFTLWISPS